MALNTTTLSAALPATGTNASVITVASATGFAAGSWVQIDSEFTRVAKTYTSGTVIPLDGRGLNGSLAVAHPATANVTVGTSTDFANPAAAVTVAYPLAPISRPKTSYSAAGAIALPTPGADAVAIINGTNALAMTLANPTADMDGAILFIVGNGKAAHTVTYTAGLGNGGSALDVLTFATGGQQCLAVIAANSIWVPLPSVLGGTLTNITITAS